MSLDETLKALEVRLLDVSIRKDTARVSAMLAENFREFGASGRVYSKREIVAFLAIEEGYTPPIVEAFNVELQTADVALATYRSARATGCSLRSSVWIHDSGNWQMLFHQGTNVGNPDG